MCAWCWQTCCCSVLVDASWRLRSYCSGPSPACAGVLHGASGAAAVTAAQLREEVRDAAGRLGRQLFDRNSQRAFAPAAAFAAESVQVRSWPRQA